MSRASERKKMGEALMAYSLVSVPVAASFLDCSGSHVRKLIHDDVLPAVRVGHLLKLDPLDLAVHVLAEREGLDREAYWQRHGEATPDHARRYVARVRKVAEMAA